MTCMPASARTDRSVNLHAEARSWTGTRFVRDLKAAFDAVPYLRACDLPGCKRCSTDTVPPRAFRCEWRDREKCRVKRNYENRIKRHAWNTILHIC